MNFFSLLPIAESGVYYAFKHSDGVGQGIVIILCIFSVIVWCLMLIKGMSLGNAYKDSRRLLGELRKRANPLALKGIMEKEDTPVSRVYKAGYNRLAQIYGGEERLYRRKQLTDGEIKVIRSAMEESVSDQIVVLEDKLILLMTAVSISPFLGLFGTVWGIMLAFTEMAQAGKPDISTLAPGISGALLTTVLGLVVAIPSLVGYNYITFYIKQITVFMDNFVEETLAKFEMERVIQERKDDEEADRLEEEQLRTRQANNRAQVQQFMNRYTEPKQPQPQPQAEEYDDGDDDENEDDIQPDLIQQPKQAPRAQQQFQQPRQDPRNNRFF